MVILFAQNREQQVRTLDDQVASRATPRLRRTSSYFVVLRRTSYLRQSHRRIGWAKTSRAIQRLPADTSSAGGRGVSAAALDADAFILEFTLETLQKAKAAHTQTHTPFPSQEKQPEVLQQRRSRSRDVHGFNGYRSLGGWWCLNMFGHQMTAGLRWKLPNDFAGGSFWLCSACCNSLSDHCSIVWIGMSRREKGWTRDS